MLTVARKVSYDSGLSTVGNFSGMLRFEPVDSLYSLREKLLFSAAAYRPPKPGGGTFALPAAAAGDALDIELNVTFSDSNGGSGVPADFGTVGLVVLGKSVTITSGKCCAGAGGGAKTCAFSLNNVPLGPECSAAPPPKVLHDPDVCCSSLIYTCLWFSPAADPAVHQVLTLRVLVDRSVVEGFAMGGRATVAMRAFGSNATSVVWTPPASKDKSKSEGSAKEGERRLASAAAAQPSFSLKVLSMRTGWRDPALPLAGKSDDEEVRPAR